MVMPCSAFSRADPSTAIRIHPQMPSCPSFAKRCEMALRVLGITLALATVPAHPGAGNPEEQPQPSLSFPLDALLHQLEQQYPFPADEWSRWQAIRPTLRDEASQAQTRTEFLQAVHRAFDALGISHLRLFDELQQSPDRFQATGRSHNGITLRWIEDRWCVASIQPGSGFRNTRLRRGDAITHIQGRQLPSLGQGDTVDTLSSVPLANFGRQGESCVVQAEDADGRSFTVEGTYGLWTGHWSRAIGNLDSLPYEFEWSQLEGIHVLRFTAFVYDLLPQIREALRSISPDEGLILDIRGNPGGMGLMANAIAGMLTDHSFLLGEMHLKQGWIAFFADPQHGAFLGPVAVLIDTFSASTAEILALGLQEAGRARIVGEPSMGAALPSKWIRLDDHWALQLPIATYRSARGRAIEGAGVQPDETVSSTREALLLGHDAPLAAALQWVRSEQEGR